MKKKSHLKFSEKLGIKIFHKMAPNNQPCFIMFSTTVYCMYVAHKISKAIKGEISNDFVVLLMKKLKQTRNY